MHISLLLQIHGMATISFVHTLLAERKAVNSVIAHTARLPERKETFGPVITTSRKHLARQPALMSMNDYIRTQQRNTEIDSTVVGLPRASRPCQSAYPQIKRKAQREASLSTSFDGAVPTLRQLVRGNRDLEKGTLLVEKNALQSQSQGEFNQEMNSARQLHG